MSDKYELTQETIDFNGIILHRIRALKDFGSVKAGSLGGFIESEKNLSQEGTCWINDYAKVFDNARVSDNAQVSELARVYDNARINGLAWVSDNARTSGNDWIFS